MRAGQTLIFIDTRAGCAGIASFASANIGPGCVCAYRIGRADSDPGAFVHILANVPITLEPSLANTRISR